MKKYFIAIASVIFLCFSLSGKAQDVNEMQENAKTFMRQGDFANAILILNRAAQIEPGNIEIIKNLSLNYYFRKDYNKSIEIIKPALDWEQADDQCFQIAGNSYQALDQAKECEKIYRKGLKKFPANGALHNELGELLWYSNDMKAIEEWEKGIETDPNYSKNYLNACRFYAATNNKIWSILYGEIFLNMEPFGNNSPEIKSILLSLYKKLYADVDIEKSNKVKNKFAETVIKLLNKQSGVAANGIDPESLTMIRTRFILDWFNEKEKTEKFPFRLFEYQRQLIQEGMFDAYNQWIFGTAQNLMNYQNWTGTHSVQHSEFTKFQKSRIFKMPQGQFYN